MNNRLRRPGAALSIVALVAVCAFASPPLAAARAGFLRLATRADFLEGSLDGIAVDSLGALLLAERAERVGELGEPFLFAMAEHPRGWVVGTGNGGKVILVRRDGGQEELFTAAEPEIFAVSVDAGGTVYAASSPDGKVYRLSADGGGEVVFDPEESYIWDLAHAADGALLVATGGEGRLYSVDRRGRSSLVYETGDTHLRRIQTLANGDLLMGTAGEGLILRRDADSGQVRTLYDSVYPEVVAFAAAPDGSVYAGVLASEASQIDLAQPAETGGNNAEGGDETAGATVAVSTSASFAGSRPVGFSGDRSVILRLAPSGVAETVWRFDEETVYSLAWRDGKLWIGTGLEGKLYSFLDEQMTLEKDVDERQVVAVTADSASPSGPAFATTNGAAVYRVTGESERRGVYTSGALDAGEVATFGTLAWRGASPADAAVRFSVRSGMSAEPDETWSGWSPPRQGTEIQFGDVAPGRYVQWRAELESGNGASPVLREVVVAYRQHNLAPRVESLTVSPPGEIRVPANFNPGNQVFEPTSPDRSGIFTTIESNSAAANGSRGHKTLWKTGYRTISWDATDPNDDDLVYTLEFRRQGTAAWLPLHDELDEDALSFDASVLPDGEYRFRLRASDRPEGADEPALSAERVSEPVINDHTPPVLEVLSRRGNRIEVRLTDAWSPLRQIELAIDAESWRAVGPADGLVDSRGEKLALELPDGAASALLRVMDSAFNTVTFDLLEVSE